MNKLFFLFFVTLAITGCATNKYSVIEGEYSYSKADGQYFSKSMHKINTETGESWRLTHDAKKGYIWKPVNHLDGRLID